MKVGLDFLDERVHGVSVVTRRAAPALRIGLSLKRGCQAAVQRAGDQLLGLGERHGRAGGEIGCETRCGLVDVRPWNDLPRDAPTDGIGRRERLAEKHQLSRTRLTHRTCQRGRQPRVAREPDPGEGGAEGSVLGEDAQVACEHEAESGSDARPVDGCHDGLGHRCQRLDDRRVVVRHSLEGGSGTIRGEPIGMLGQVLTDAESLPLGSEDHGANRLVSADVRERLEQRCLQRLVQRVSLVRPVQGHGCDVAVSGDKARAQGRCPFVRGG